VLSLVAVVHAGTFGTEISPDVSIRPRLARRIDEGQAECWPDCPVAGPPGKSTMRRSKQMRFMVLIPANEKSEAGVMPSERLLAEMGKYNEELVKAGVLLAGDGLHPTSNGARVKFSGRGTTVIDGPFTEAKELIAGYYLWQVKSMDEAIEWVKRLPNPDEEDVVVEIRQVFEADEFGPELTPELRELQARLRARAAEQHR
jgi:hypothetical protein